MSFKADLSVEDKALMSKIETPESLVDMLTAHVNSLNTPHRSRLHDAITNVASFAKSLGPYFGIVEMIVSSHPEYAAIAWGGVRLVFQVRKIKTSNYIKGKLIEAKQMSSQYVQYFEKLAKMFAQISEKLPRYSRQFDLISDRGQKRRHGSSPGPSSRKAEDKWESYHISLAKSLAYVYQDIMCFCHDACSILPRQGLGSLDWPS
jgi:hypothetical protein